MGRVGRNRAARIETLIPHNKIILHRIYLKNGTKCGLHLNARGPFDLWNGLEVDWRGPCAGRDVTEAIPMQAVRRIEAASSVPLCLWL